MKRKPDWKPIFGQIGAAQTHLKRRVKEGDLFLFFGTFRKTIKQNDTYKFETKEKFHAIYGYLQIGEIISLDNKTEIPEWMDYHPHAHQKRLEDKNNTIYVARDKLTWDSDMLGAGVLSFTDKLVLTKKGCSKSRWNLPLFFKDVEISYHPCPKKSWKDDYFQSAAIGQEFVIDDNENIKEWAKDKIKNG